MIDLRSDTVTRPTPGMRAAMMAAEVGDDIWGDDPTMHRLLARMADITGKEAALFFPSGTQSNLAAVMCHCERGDEVILGQSAHTYIAEAGGVAVLGSVHSHAIENASDGTLPLEKVAAAIKPIDIHSPRTRLLALENTIGGKMLPESYVEAATALARQHGLATHLDGARLFNAAVASQRNVKDLCAPFETVSICFSKGLGAPIGTVLVGPKPLIARAHHWRKMLGGGMRQVGILAATCLYALDHHIERLADDHANAAALAEGLRRIPALKVDGPHTNIVMVDIPPEQCRALADRLRAAGILAAIRPRTRFVTHLDVTRADVDRVTSAIAGAFAP
ncbi:MAG: low-specificity L-threonine aldolase [Alphaproteobacteria bacterium]|nr:low-specificity L-threonine aldolase [Alphaproteobacteria bacterium]